MVMIIFNLIMFFNIKVSLFFDFLTPFCLFSGFFMASLVFIIFISFIYSFYFPFFWGGGGLAYIFGCDLISYGLILLSL